MINDIKITEANGKKKIIGTYDDKKNIFTTKRSLTKHLLKKYNAWALDKKLVETILAPKGAIIVIHETSERVEYRINASEFLDLAREVNFNEHRPQLYLHRDKFQTLEGNV